MEPPLSAGLMTVCGSWRNCESACWVWLLRLGRVVDEVRVGRFEQIPSHRRLEKIWRLRLSGGGGLKELGFRKGGCLVVVE